MSWSAIARIVEDETPEWMNYAACWVENIPPDVFFPSRGEATLTAKEICRRCPVRKACLEYALTNGEEFGVWGGESERARRRIRAARRRNQRATA